MGGYGFLRFSVPMLPQASASFAPFMFTLSVVAVIYTSLVALAQRGHEEADRLFVRRPYGRGDDRHLHVQRAGHSGALFQMLSHGVVSAALFLVVGVVYDRIHTHEIARFGGLADRMPLYATTFMIFTLAAMGLPGTSGFVGEFLVIVGSLQVNFWLALLGATGMILGAAYMLYLYRRIIFGRLTKEDLRSILDLSPREIAVFAPLILLTLWMGIYPSAFTGFWDASVASIGAHHTAAIAPAVQVAGMAPMNWAIALPEIALSVVAMAILIFGVLRRDETFSSPAWFALGGLLLAALLVVTSARGVGYHGQFVGDAFAGFVKILILAGAALALILSLDYNRQHRIARFEYPVLMVLSVVGMMVMVSAANLMTLYLGLELQSLALYVLAAFARDELRSSEAGLKYFVLGALASGLLLYGISLVYGFSGTMDFAALAETLPQPALPRRA